MGARQPETMESLGFYVLPPYHQVQSGVFGDLVTEPTIATQVAERVHQLGGVHAAWLEQWFEPTLAAAHIELLSWERLLATIRGFDSGAELDEFYERCLQLNTRRAAR